MDSRVPSEVAQVLKLPNGRKRCHWEWMNWPSGLQDSISISWLLLLSRCIIYYSLVRLLMKLISEWRDKVNVTVELCTSALFIKVVFTIYKTCWNIIINQKHLDKKRLNLSSDLPYDFITLDFYRFNDFRTKHDYIHDLSIYYLNYHPVCNFGLKSFVFGTRGWRSISLISCFFNLTVFQPTIFTAVLSTVCDTEADA